MYATLPFQVCVLETEWLLKNADIVDSSKCSKPMVVEDEGERRVVSLRGGVGGHFTTELSNTETLSSVLPPLYCAFPGMRLLSKSIKEPLL